MQTIRVLALLEATSITGTAKAVLEFAYEASRRGSEGPRVEVSVVNFVRGGQEPTNALISALSRASIPCHFVWERRRFDGAVFAQLRSVISREAPDIVWSNSIKSHFLVRAGRLAQARKWIAYHHGYTTTDLKMRLYNQLDRWSLPAADCVLTVCRPFADHLASLGVDPQRIRIQHMPVRPFATDNSACEELCPRLGITANERVILCVGRLSHEKGHADLLLAFARMRAIRNVNRLRLIVVGDGPERCRLEKIRQARGLGDAVVFAGHQDNVTAFYGIADVLALPSHSEGSPNVLLEAMEANVPVVATNVGGVPELTHNGTSALLVKPGDHAALADAIFKVLESEALRNQLTSSAREVVAEHSPDNYYRSLVCVFKSVLNNGSSLN
jgi:glycosyltransferase involved in cell wall biosynthesis